MALLRWELPLATCTTLAACPWPSPVLGATIVNLSGLIDHARHPTASLAASYAWFAVVVFLIWEGNRRRTRLPRC